MTELRSAGATDVGRIRTENQDRYLDRPGLWIVADGMGGHRGGEVAAEVAVDTIAALVADRGPSALAGSIRDANAAVIGRAVGDPDLAGMGTTVTALALAPGAGGAPGLLVANVGDSRTYRLGAGADAIEQLTVDHSLVAEWEREGRITASQAATHPHRNVITRALGVDADVEVDTWHLDLVSGDRYLLCSDGLTNELTDVEITDVLRAHADPHDAAASLTAAARSAGGRDNITVVVVDVVSVDEVPDVMPPSGSTSTSGKPPPTRPRRVLTWRVAVFVAALLALLGGTAAIIVFAARGTYYVGVADGGDDAVVIFQGRPGGLLWFEPTAVETTDLSLDDLPAAQRQQVEAGQVEATLDEARDFVAVLRERAAEPSTTTTTSTTSTTATTSTTVTTTSVPAPSAATPASDAG